MTRTRALSPPLARRGAGVAAAILATLVAGGGAVRGAAAAKGAPPPAAAPAGTLVVVPTPPPAGADIGEIGGVGNIGISVGGRGAGPGEEPTGYAPGGSGGALLGSDLYVVQPGDTLWDLCGYFFGNPYLWPKIWAYNPVITNPHWIYPGDVLRLAPEGAAVAPAPSPASEPVVVIDRKVPLAPEAIYLHKIAYVTAQEFEKHGTVTGAMEDKFLLSVYDVIYIQYAKEKDLPAVGDALTIYERSEGDGDEDRPKEARALGSLVSIKGRAKVTRIERDTGIATAEITEAVGTIERGHRAGPFKGTMAVVPPAVNRVELTGTVVEGIRDEEVIGKYNVVIIDRGKDHGVELGNRLWVLRRGDGLPGPAEAEKVEKKDAKRTDLPLEVVAELRVIDVKEKTSTGVVTSSVRDVQIGDKLLMRKGY